MTRYLHIDDNNNYLRLFIIINNYLSLHAYFFSLNYLNIFYYCPLKKNVNFTTIVW